MLSQDFPIISESKTIYRDYRNKQLVKKKERGQLKKHFYCVREKEGSKEEIGRRQNFLVSPLSYIDYFKFLSKRERKKMNRNKKLNKIKQKSFFPFLFLNSL